jgi:hypothetical protein
VPPIGIKGSSFHIVGTNLYKKMNYQIFCRLF